MKLFTKTGLIPSPFLPVLTTSFNYGDDYTHFYTSGFYAVSANAYLGNFTLQVYSDNGNRFLEGETRGYNAGNTTLAGTYQHKNWTFSLYYEQPFFSKYKEQEAEVMNRNVHKLMTVYNSDKINLVSLKITYCFDHGRKYKSSEKNINLRDSDAGILK